MGQVMLSPRVPVPTTFGDERVQAILNLTLRTMQARLYFSGRPATQPILALPLEQWPPLPVHAAYSPAQYRVAVRECSVRMDGLQVPYRQPQPDAPGLTIVYDVATAEGYAEALRAAEAVCQAVNAAIRRLPEEVVLGPPATVPVRRLGGLAPDWPFAPTVCEVLSSPEQPVPCRVTYRPAGQPGPANPWLACRDCVVRLRK